MQSGKTHLTIYSNHQIPDLTDCTFTPYNTCLLGDVFKITKFDTTQIINRLEYIINIDGNYDFINTRKNLSKLAIQSIYIVNEIVYDVDGIFVAAKIGQKVQIGKM